MALAFKYCFYSPQYFYYEKCVHEYGQWNYDKKGDINTSVVSYEQIITTEPTCRQQGKCEYHCPDCEYYYEETIWELGHSYSNCKCIRCGYVDNLYINGGSFEYAQELLQFNAEGFDLYETNYSFIYASETKGATSTMTITAKTAVKIRFIAEIFKEADCVVTISINGETYTLEPGMESYTFELQAGDQIEITCQDSREEDSTWESYPMIIKNMYVSSLYEPV